MHSIQPKSLDPGVLETKPAALDIYVLLFKTLLLSLFIAKTKQTLSPSLVQGE